MYSHDRYFNTMIMNIMAIDRALVLKNHSGYDGLTHRKRFTKTFMLKSLVRSLKQSTLVSGPE